MLKEKPLVTLITVAYNSEKTIKDTIESILIQSYSNIEYLIIDGLSSDNTVKIAKEYEDRFKKKGYKFVITSEKDSGLYDAMNKGIKLANGEIIGILNADDFYISSSIITKVVKQIIEENADCLYADLLYVDELDINLVTRKWKAGKGEFKFGWNPPHPSTFITKTTYQKYGLYKTEYEISSDYDLLYKIIYKGKSKVTYLPEYIVKMRKGGKSTKSIKSNFIANIEIYRTLEENEQKFKLITIFLRVVVKIRQFF